MRLVAEVGAHEGRKLDALDSGGDLSSPRDSFLLFWFVGN